MSRLLASFLVSACLLGSATAGEISDKAAEAEELAAAGDFLPAMALLDEAADRLWGDSPLVFRRATWVAEPPFGFGAYSPRESNEFGSGDEMIIYAEPVGFGWRKSGDIWRTAIATDLTVKDADGEVLYEQEDFQKLEIASRVRNREFMATFTYTFSGIPPGEYSVETTLRDSVTGKSGTLSLPFVIR
jgi:hypothetical protein